MRDAARSRKNLAIFSVVSSFLGWCFSFVFNHLLICDWRAYSFVIAWGFTDLLYRMAVPIRGGQVFQLGRDLLFEIMENIEIYKHTYMLPIFFFFHYSSISRILRILIFASSAKGL